MSSARGLDFFRSANLFCRNIRIPTLRSDKSFFRADGRARNIEVGFGGRYANLIWNRIDAE